MVRLADPVRFRTPPKAAYSPMNWGNFCRSSTSSTNRRSSIHLTEVANSGPVAINPVIFAECAYVYTDVTDLFSDLPVGMELLLLPYEAAFLAGKAFAGYRRLGGKRERILGDFYVGGHAQVAGLTLLTRDAARYRTYFPKVRLIAPA